MYSTWNSAQCYVPAWIWGGFGGEWMHVYICGSPFTVHLKLSQHFFLFFSWRLITLQFCHHNFCHTSTWISHGFFGYTLIQNVFGVKKIKIKLKKKKNLMWSLYVESKKTYIKSKKTWYKWTYLQNRKSHRLGDQTHGCQGGRGWGEGIVREFGMDMFTLLSFKWITNKDLLYSPEDSAQCYVTAWMVGRLRENGSVHMNGWVPLLFTWNYHNIVNWPYSNTKFNI